jgi:hypothetical protein
VDNVADGGGVSRRERFAARSLRIVPRVLLMARLLKALRPRSKDASFEIVLENGYLDISR